MQWSRLIAERQWFVLEALLAILVFGVKGGVVSALGIVHFPDSANYLTTIVHSDYPALYPWLLHFNESLLGGWSLTAALIFALSWALFVRLIRVSVKVAIVLTLVIAIDPYSTFFCRAMMSEALFMPLLLLWFGVWYRLQRTQHWKWAIALGVLAGTLYGTRFAFVFIGVVPLIIWGMQRSKWTLNWRLFLVYVAALQFVLLPLRYSNFKVFDTWKLNGITGATLWNNASVLYPNSEIQQSPTTNFERYLSQAAATNYTTENALGAIQIWDTTLPYRTYEQHRQYSYLNGFELSAEAGNTARRLIASSPWKYLRSFVFSNYVQLFQHNKSYQDPVSGATIRYAAWESWAMLLLMVVGGLLLRALKRKGEYNAWEALILSCSWFTFLVLPLVAPMHFRYHWLWMPFLLLAITGLLVRWLRTR